MIKATRYACYYGMGKLDALAQYDLVIVQAAHYSTAEVTTLRSAGVTVCAYLTLGESREQEIPIEWVVRDPLTGAATQNEGWQTTYLDCRTPGWQAEVLERRVPRLCEQGFDGLLLDTLDVQERFPETRPGVIALVQRIKARFPQLQLIPNRGFSILSAIANVSYALLFEAFSTYATGAGYAAWDKAALAWTEERARESRIYMGEKQVLALDYAEPENLALRAWAQKRAAEHGWLSFVSTHALDWLP
ncbi:MAG: endo alpha-1,4 polygalactosaminidase [Anaerolineae bacterium]|nr:endo alpha-1,4 polygalactosaminidase [Anaerolineae bacterium]